MSHIQISGDVHGEVILYQDEVFAHIAPSAQNPHLPRIILPIFTYTIEVVQIDGLWYRLNPPNQETPQNAITSPAENTSIATSSISGTASFPGPFASSQGADHLPMAEGSSVKALDIQQRLTELTEYEDRLRTWATQLARLDEQLRAKEAVHAISVDATLEIAEQNSRDEAQDAISDEHIQGDPSAFLNSPVVQRTLSLLPRDPTLRPGYHNSTGSIEAQPLSTSASLPDLPRATPPKRPPPSPPKQKIPLIPRRSDRFALNPNPEGPTSIDPFLPSTPSILPAIPELISKSSYRAPPTGIHPLPSILPDANATFDFRLPPLMRAEPNMSVLKFAEPTEIQPRRPVSLSIDLSGGDYRDVAFGSARPLRDSGGSDREGSPHRAETPPSGGGDRPGGPPSAGKVQRRLMKHAPSVSAGDGPIDGIRFANRRATISVASLYFPGPDSPDWDSNTFLNWRLTNGLAQPEAHVVGDAAGKNPFTIAVQNGTVGAVKYMLKTYNSIVERINKPDTFGHYPLLLAVTSDSLEVVKLLVDYGADLTITRPGTGETCLHEASNADILAFLLSRLFSTSSSYSTPSNASSPSSSAPSTPSGPPASPSPISSMINSLATSATSTTTTSTPLKRAIARRSAACVKLLLARGADQGQGEKSAFVAAAATGDLSILVLLRADPVSTGAVASSTPINARPKPLGELHEALRMAAMAHSLECFAHIVLSTRCRLDVQHPSMQNPPLLWTAATAGSLDIVKFLLDRGMTNDLAWIDAESEFRRCVVHETAQLGRTPLVQYLIAHGANPAIPDRDGKTVLHKIINSLASFPQPEDLEAGLELIQAIILTQRINPLMPAAAPYVPPGSNDLSVAPLKDETAQKMRLEFLDHVSSGSDGEAALHYAAKFGLVNIVKFLINAGANKKIKTGKKFLGKTPEELADSAGHVEVVAALNAKPEKATNEKEGNRDRAQTMAPGYGAKKSNPNLL